MGPTWGPSGDDRTQEGPKLVQWALLSGELWTQWTPICSHPNFIKVAHSFHSFLRFWSWVPIIATFAHILCDTWKFQIPLDGKLICYCRDKLILQCMALYASNVSSSTPTPTHNHPITHPPNPPPSFSQAHTQTTRTLRFTIYHVW